MARTKVLAMVLAGGAGGRMEVLTQTRAKPALPFAGVYRLIDMSLSNLRNSGISDVWVVVQYETQSINDALANGRPWDLDRTHGGLRIIPPQQDADEEGGWHEGNADALYRNKELIRAFDPDVLLVLSADHIYRLDYNDVIEQHLAHKADVTIVTTQVPKDQASNHAVVEVGTDGRITGFAYKPEEPATDIVATEIFVYQPEAVLETLERLVSQLDAEGASTGLEDFGHHLLPALVDEGSVRDFRLPGYWKDVGRPETYFQSHMDLLADTPELALDDPAWPIFTLEHQRLPARIAPSARIGNALISPGCRIQGTVERSVLAPGVVVGEGATVSDAIVLQDTVIEAGATVRFAIVDRDVTVGEGATIGEPPVGQLPTTEELVLIGQGAKVRGNATIERGARMEPGARA